MGRRNRPLDRDDGYDGKKADVTLSGRTLYKDGAWNTLCLPFDVTISGSPLAGDGVTVMELNSSASSLSSDGTLTINFTTVAGGTLTAGRPYIIKWDNTGGSIKNPEFSGVTLSADDPVAVTFSNALGSDCQFVGSYSTLDVTADNIDEIVYLGAGNKLGYSSAPRTLHACRAHFVVPTSSAGAPRAMTRSIVNFGNGETTGIRPVPTTGATSDDAWYTLDGRKLAGQPTAKGVYVHNGRKEAVK